MMSANITAASTPWRRTGWSVTSAQSSGRSQTSKSVWRSRIARYSGSDRPACRMNQTGVRSTGSRRAARTRSGSTRPRLASCARPPRRPLDAPRAPSGAGRDARPRAGRGRERGHRDVASRRREGGLALARRAREPDRVGRAAGRAAARGRARRAHDAGARGARADPAGPVPARARPRRRAPALVRRGGERDAGARRRRGCAHRAAARGPRRRRGRARGADSIACLAARPIQAT